MAPPSSLYRGIIVQAPSVGLNICEANSSWPRWKGVRPKTKFLLQRRGQPEGSSHRWRGLLLDWFLQFLALFRVYPRRKYSPLSWILQLALRCTHTGIASHVLKHHCSPSYRSEGGGLLGRWPTVLGFQRIFCSGLWSIIWTSFYSWHIWGKRLAQLISRRYLVQSQSHVFMEPHTTSGSCSRETLNSLLYIPALAILQSRL